MDLGDVANATKDIVKELTNVIGLIEKNIASYDRIKARFRRRRVNERLEEILNRLTQWHRFNCDTLWRLGQLAERGTLRSKELSAYLNNDEDALPFSYRSELIEYQDALLSTQALIDDFKKDIISVDYKLYEALQDAVDGRMKIVAMLVAADRKDISIENIKTAYESYRALVEGVHTVKDALQSAAKNASKAVPAPPLTRAKKQELPKRAGKNDVQM
jgi:hypothetical protein